MIAIIDAVGRGSKNHSADVKNIQGLLNASPITKTKLVVDGKYGQKTYQAILLYQMRVFQQASAADGVINPGGKTLALLNNPHTHPRRNVTLEEVKSRAVALGGHIGPPVQRKTSSFGKLTEVDFQNAAKTLGPNVEVAMIKAFAEVESGGKSGFGANGFPKIAFEGHIFRKYTHKKYDKTYPLLSYPYVKKAGPEWQKNNASDAKALESLNAAIKLDREAAYKACSWGMFQVMGFNYSDCGFSTVDDFVTSMKSGESGQLKAFIGFCSSTPGMKDALAKNDFAKCASLYNGEDYGDYNKRISNAYKKYSLQ